jgi:hypothetical protein
MTEGIEEGLIATGFEVRLLHLGLFEREIDFQRDSCYSVVTDHQSARPILPIELSSIVVSLETLTRELTKKLSGDEARAVIAELCERLQTIPDDKRGPNRPFTR